PSYASGEGLSTTLSGWLQGLYRPGARTRPPARARNTTATHTVVQSCADTITLRRDPREVKRSRRPIGPARRKWMGLLDSRLLESAPVRTAAGVLLGVVAATLWYLQTNATPRIGKPIPWAG